MKYLAIDIGASSGRHILGTIEDGKLMTEEIYRFPNAPKMKDGHLVWDTGALFRNVLEGLKKAGETGKKPDFVGIDTWAVDYALLDAAGNRLGDVYCYRDGRTQSAIASIHERFPFAALYEKTGIQFQPFNTVYQLEADKLSGRLERARHMLMLPDYLHYLLTGKMRQEYTDATSTGMVNARTHVWDQEIIDRLSFPDRLFDGLSQPGTLVGRFSSAVRDFVGYDAQVVLPATHDTASAVLAAPVGADAFYISSGTWSLLGVEQPSAHTDEESRRFNYSNEGSIGYTFRYQKNIMGLWMIQQLRHETGDKYSFAEIAQMARENPDKHTVDVNDEAFLAPQSMTNVVREKLGVSLPFGGMAYCVFRSLALSYAESVRQLESLTGRRYEKINVIGGGCKNDLLNELTARETGKTVVAGPAEATAMGNLLMQMIGAGEIKDIAEGRKIIMQSTDIREVK